VRGVRDEQALWWVLARPRQLWSRGERNDLAGLAAAYGATLTRKRPYRDGNIPIAFMVMWLFMGLNGYGIEDAEDNVVTRTRRLAGGQLFEMSLAAWIRRQAVPLQGIRL